MNFKHQENEYFRYKTDKMIYLYVDYIMYYINDYIILCRYMTIIQRALGRDVGILNDKLLSYI